jgi:ribosomal protein S3AE
MATDITPQDLIIYRRIMTTALATITNEMQANNAKLSFKVDFTL